jgi:hypothetical protein
MPSEAATISLSPELPVEASLLDHFESYIIRDDAASRGKTPSRFWILLRQAGAKESACPQVKETGVSTGVFHGCDPATVSR